MGDPLLIARNPDPDSSLPYLVRIPLGDGIVLRTRETWPRTSKVYCHRHVEPWPADAEIVETVALRECSRRGAAIDVVAEDFVRATMRSKVRRLLASYDYPPDAEAKAIELVLEQAELFAKGEVD